MRDFLLTSLCQEIPKFCKKNSYRSWCFQQLNWLTAVHSTAIYSPSWSSWRRPMVLSALQEGALWSMISCSINHRCRSPRTTGSCPSWVRARDEEGGGGGATLSSEPAASRLRAQRSSWRPQEEETSPAPRLTSRRRRRRRKGRMVISQVESELRPTLDSNQHTP